MEALVFWREFPRQTASDLRRFFRAHIRDWHQGRMSSYELLELFGAEVDDIVTVAGAEFDADTPIITSRGPATVALIADEKTRTIRVDFPPEDGALALAMRGGERAEWQQMLAQSANELAVMRATFAPDAQADQYDARLFLSAARARHYEAEAAQAAADNTISDEPGGLYSLWQQQEVS